MFVNKILNFVDAYLLTHSPTIETGPLRGISKRGLPWDFPHPTYYPIPGGAAVLTNKAQG